MINMSVSFKHVSDTLWPDDDPAKVLGKAKAIEVCVVAHGTASGKPSVVIKMTLEDGSIVYGMTSGALFLTAAKMAVTRHPELQR